MKHEGGPEIRTQHLKYWINGQCVYGGADGLKNGECNRGIPFVHLVLVKIKYVTEGLLQ